MVLANGPTKHASTGSQLNRTSMKAMRQKTIDRLYLRKFISLRTTQTQKTRTRNLSLKNYGTRVRVLHLTDVAENHQLFSVLENY